VAQCGLMSQQKLSVIILAAGKGSRMKSSLPKVLHPLCGLPLISHILNTVEALTPAETVVVLGEGMEDVANEVSSHPVGAKIVIQNPPKGSGDGARVGLGGLSEKALQKGTTLILAGDAPLVSGQTLQALVEKQQSSKAAVVVGGFRTMDPAAYGRLVTGGERGETSESLQKIVEFKDASEEEKQINLCNSGFYACDSSRLEGLLENLDNKNAQGEYYVTDIVANAIEGGASCGLIEMPEMEAHGINTPQDLAVAEQVAQNQLRRLHLVNGVRMTDPNTVYFSADTKIGENTTLEPNIVFGPGVTIGRNVAVKAYSHFEDCEIHESASIGPFARIRPGSVIGEKARIGNFVETKKAVVGTGAKINHLSYVGDATLGANSNIGAGTITCNYDGETKSKTTIGEGVFVGSNSTLIAPVTLADYAYVAAATTVRQNVDSGALAFNTKDQQARPNYLESKKKKKAS